MAEAKAVLDRGCGFVVLDRLPVRELGRERSKDLYWLLSSLIARPVAQAFKGMMLYMATGLPRRPLDALGQQALDTVWAILFGQRSFDG